MAADGLPQSDFRPAPDFSTTLQQRAEEALSASVHHASLSQQYLTLAQKYSALAEQARSGTSVYSEVSQLEREATTGRPASPIVFAQRTEIPSGVAGADHGRAATQPFDLSGTQSAECASMVRPPAVESGVPFYSPSARTSIQDLQIQPAALQPSSEMTPPSTIGTNAATETPGPLGPRTSQEHLAAADIAESGGTNSSLGAPEQDTAGRDDLKGGVSEGPKSRKANDRNKVRRKSGKRFSLKKLVERLRLTAMEQAERVRVKARKGDLKPKIRKTTEEIAEEIKRSRKPASISTCITIVGLLILALQRLEYVEPVELPPLSASFSLPTEEPEAVLMEPPAEMPGEQQEQPTEEQPPEEPMPEPEMPEPEMPPETEPPPEPTEPMPEQPLEEPAETEVAGALPETPNGTIPTNPDAAPGKAGSFNHRSEAGRKVLLEKFGGSVGSESAVGLALEWLAQRQRRDGSWDFSDVGPCTSPGRIQNPIGGTAYALLPFLAAGNTHRTGPYKRQVTAGLDYLMTVGVVVPAGYDLRGVINKRDTDEEPNYAYYVHGAATMALCEAYGMTKDRKLKPACEGAVQFLLNSQDPRGGGWRYVPQQPGSTSCTAIQLMALKAGEKAGMRIPETTWRGISYYLDTVQVDREGRYGYEVEKKAYDGSVTAMALLSRMYLGWERDDGDLRKGVEILDRKGPYDNFYYNYFGTQVMKNWGGEEWVRWNGRLRDDLVAWQEKDGDARGSWAPRDRSEYSVAGGRLLTTCLAALTLEVYYRYQPLLAEQEGTEVTEGAKMTDGTGRDEGK